MLPDVKTSRVRGRPEGATCPNWRLMFRQGLMADRARPLASGIRHMPDYKAISLLLIASHPVLTY